MKLPKDIGIRAKYEPAMALTSQAEADEYFAALVEHNMSFGTNRTEAERVERENVCYYAGYCDHETRRRVERLFRGEHPVFGSIEKKGPPTSDQAFAAGLSVAAQRMKKDPSHE